MMELFMGKCRVEFTNQVVRTITFVDYKVTYTAIPIVIKDDMGNWYNWNTIISVRPLED